MLPMHPTSRYSERDVGSSSTKKPLTKGKLRKLTTLRKSVGHDIGEQAFASWLSSQSAATPTDNDAELIADTLWSPVQDGKLTIPRGGYLVRRGRGRIVVRAMKQ